MDPRDELIGIHWMDCLVRHVGHDNAARLAVQAIDRVALHRALTEANERDGLSVPAAIPYTAEELAAAGREADDFVLVDPNTSPPVTCFICGATVKDVPAAMEAGWSPSIDKPDGTEVYGPFCETCYDDMGAELNAPVMD